MNGKFNTAPSIIDLHD